jgi:hypothetical protein
MQRTNDTQNLREFGLLVVAMLSPRLRLSEYRSSSIARAEIFPLRNFRPRFIERPGIVSPSPIRAKKGTPFLDPRLLSRSKA